MGGGVTVFNHIRTRGGEGWGVGQLCSIAYIQEEGGATVFNHIRTRGGEGWGVG